MAAPSEKEIEIVNEFRKMISDIESSEKFTDLYCLSWLRARDLNLTEANNMIRNSLKWRKENEVDSVLDWKPPSDFLSDYDYEVIGIDNEGRPIVIVPFGEWDIRKAANAGNAKEFVKYGIQFFETMIQKTKESSQNLGKEVTQFAFIADLANYSMRQLTSITTINAILQLTIQFDANYPETLGCCYVVNASRIFHMLFSILKPMLSARTLGKVNIYMKPEKWQPVLQAAFPLDVLPQEFGGSRVGRKTSIGHIPHVDKGLTERLSLNRITIEVGAGKKFELEFTVTKPKSCITWTFKTENYDIGFSINFNRTTEEVFPMKRCDSHINEEMGEFICKKPGEYFVIFDNTFSKMRGKTVHYLIELIEPEED